MKRFKIILVSCAIIIAVSSAFINRPGGYCTLYGQYIKAALIIPPEHLGTITIASILVVCVLIISQTPFVNQITIYLADKVVMF